MQDRLTNDTPTALIDQVRSAAASRTALRIAGGDTKAFYGEPVGGQPLSTRAWSGIVAHEPSELVTHHRHRRCICLQQHHRRRTLVHSI